MAVLNELISISNCYRILWVGGGAAHPCTPNFKQLSAARDSAGGLRAIATQAHHARFGYANSSKIPTRIRFQISNPQRRAPGSERFTVLRTPLELYATFQSLEEERRLIQSKSATWHDWPKQFLTPGQPVREYAKRHRKRTRFFQYIQWVASEQLAEIRRTAEQLAMPIGLYHDVALGADRNGAEAWVDQSVLALGADGGAPPDAFAPEGQNWGLPPMNPRAARQRL